MTRKAACPTCGRDDFASRDGLKQHHGRVHGEPLSLTFKFWEKVDIRGDDDCWPWTAFRDPNDYGRILVDGRPVPAQRVAWELTNGPTDEHVLHHCDNPACVNPRHLYTGTHQQNMRDAAKRERINSKLTADDVREIRRRRDEDVPLADLAEEYGVGVSTISAAATGTNWRHVD